MLPVSMCNGASPLEFERGLETDPSLDVLSSLQSAGVGGTVSSAVPVPGGRLCLKGSVGASP